MATIGFQRARAATTSGYMREHVIFVGMARVRVEANLAYGTARFQHILKHVIWPWALAGSWVPGPGIVRYANRNQSGPAVDCSRTPRNEARSAGGLQSLTVRRLDPDTPIYESIPG